MTKVLILANGEPPSWQRIHELLENHDLFLATDGAVHKAASLGVYPDLVTGDFDSISMDVASGQFPNAEFVETLDQSHTDLEKAVQVAIDRGATFVTIAGATGGRIDHTLGNLSLLIRFHNQVSITLVDNWSETRVISGTDDAPGEWVVAANPGDTIALVTFDGQARANLTGVQWPLDNYRVPIGANAVSNKATENLVRFQARGGALMACRLDKSYVSGTQFTAFENGWLAK
jgi:thiamine pyrophosphokinase